MTYCEHCGGEIGYLPFKCKYCGGVFCKKHRLPENHECTFELKHTPVVPTTSGESRALYQDLDIEKPTSRDYLSKGPRELKKYLKRQEKRNKQTYRSYRRDLTRTRDRTTKGTTYLIVTIFILSIAAIFFPHFLCLSSFSFTSLYLWTFLTAPFVYYSSSFFGIFFLFILIFCFSNILKSIELRFGTKFFLGVYLFSAGLTGLIYYIIWLPLEKLYPTEIINFPAGLASGGIYGVIALMIFFNLNRDMTFFAYFIPLRMKGKSIIILLILISLIPGILFGLLIHPLYFLLYFPDLGGILGAYLVYYFKFRPRNRRIQY